MEELESKEKYETWMGSSRKTPLPWGTFGKRMTGQVLLQLLFPTNVVHVHGVLFLVKAVLFYNSLVGVRIAGSRRSLLQLLLRGIVRGGAVGGP
jgi:hypothetical protein